MKSDQLKNKCYPEGHWKPGDPPHRYFTWAKERPIGYDADFWVLCYCDGLKMLCMRFSQPLPLDHRNPRWRKATARQLQILKRQLREEWERGPCK